MNKYTDENVRHLVTTVERFLNHPGFRYNVERALRPFTADPWGEVISGAKSAADLSLSDQSDETRAALDKIDWAAVAWAVVLEAEEWGIVERVGSNTEE